MLLNVHSCFSLRYGTLNIEQLVKGLLLNGYDTAVLTDINNSSAALDFIKECRKYGLNGLVGMEFRNADELLFIGIAKNEEGFRELNELMTAANQRNSLLPVIAPEFNHVFVVYPFGKPLSHNLRDYEYIGVRPDQLNRIALELQSTQQRYVILKPLSFQDKQAHLLHRQLRAIDHNLLISQLKPTQIADTDEVFLSKSSLIRLYKGFPQLIRNTEKLLQDCSFNFNFKNKKNKKNFRGSHYEDNQLLYTYAMEGFLRRYGKTNKVAMDRVLKELEIIKNLEFATYFLITDDICRHARARNFHYVGRGSGANSVVAYCLGITDVCPIELDLYFERFLNPKRNVSPDFDMDFSWNERDEIYDYIFQKYEKGNVALMGAMSTFRSRSIIRELGKIYGLPRGDIDRLVHEPQHMLNKNEITNMILSVYDQMSDFPNQRTVHASGVLISEKPLTYYSAMDFPPKDRPTIQFDMYVAEDIKFEKFDILSQRGIGHIKDCRKIVFQNQGIRIETSEPQRFFKDEKIAQQLRSANTIGCFYIESPAMRQLLTKLKCDEYRTLVAASSIIRPGVASSGMMKTYIERHHDPQKVEYMHPVFKEQLEETYGVMVYQEDVMKIGHHFGGLDLSDADILRRIMSGKKRDEKHLGELHIKFTRHCEKMGYPKDISQEIWRQMESFAGYSFNKAHSASFAVESYQSLYLKTYFPLEFMVSVLNNYGGFYQRKVYVNEARNSGGNICLPCVNKSKYNTSIDGKDLYLGFDCLLNLEEKLAVRIVNEREQNGNYRSLENFILRTEARLEQLVVLIRCGAFRFTGTGKKELLWEAHLRISGKQQKTGMVTLFETLSTKQPMLPKLESSLLEDMYDEMELMGFPVSGSMFDLAKSSFRGEIMAKDLCNYEGKTVRMVGDFIAEKKVRSRNVSNMKFGTFLDVEGHFFDTVHFPQSLKSYPLNGNGLYLILGKVTVDFGCPSLEVQKCARMPMLSDPRSE